MLSLIHLPTILATSALGIEDIFLPKVVRHWMEESKDLPEICHGETTELKTGESLHFLRFGKCKRIQSNCQYIPYGSLDQEGRLEGFSELAIHWIEGDSDDMKVEEDEDDEDDMMYCYSVHVPLTIKTVKGVFVKGVPQGRVSIKHRNGEETIGTSVNGVLHGVTIVRHKEGSILFLGRYSHGRPVGQGWAFSPSYDATPGAIAFMTNNGEVICEVVSYVDVGKNKIHSGHYNQESGSLSVFISTDLTTRVKDCLPYIDIHHCQESDIKYTLELPFLVRVVGGRVRVSLKNLVVFNRVPKTGSQSMLHLIKDLSEEAETFHWVSFVSRSVEYYSSDKEENRELVEFISSQPFPFVWVRHYNFFNPEEFGVPPFIFINIVRDPVDRVISDFYYRR